jgi:hypothetical protein
MGYYTRYELSIQDDPKGPYLDPTQVISDLRKECDYAKYALNENGDTQESCKWYDHEDDLRKFSKKYRGTVFVLKGEGEETGDLWVKYFLNGKMQVTKAKISFDPYDPSKVT